MCPEHQNICFNFFFWFTPFGTSHTGLLGGVLNRLDNYFFGHAHMDCSGCHICMERN